MKKYSLCAVVLCSVLMAGTAVFGETKLTISGQLRARSEAFQKEFTTEYRLESANYLRSRLAVEAVVDTNTHVFIQLQDSRLLGNDSQSGTFTNRGNVDLHQGYIELDRVWTNRLGFKAGRFEVNLGNERVFGSDEWNNVSRAWEGSEVRYGTPGASISGYELIRYAASSVADDDFVIHGLYSSLKQVRLDLFGFWEHNGQSVFPGSEINLLDRFSTGIFLERQINRLGIVSNAVYQFGERNVRVGQSASERFDISAYLLTVQFGYTFPSWNNLWVAGGIDYASGDDNLHDNRETYYDNLYYSSHKFRGYMDYFEGSSSSGLIDAELRGSLDLAAQWSLSVELHSFSTPVAFHSYVGPDEITEAHDLGREVDITLRTSSLAGVIAQGGFFMFYPTEAFAHLNDPSPGSWIYAMLITNF